MCGLVLATHTGSCFGYLKLIKGPTKPKFEWFLLFFMLTLAEQCWIYAACLLYIYKRRCLSVCLYVCIIILAKPEGGFFSEIWHDDRFGATYLKLGMYIQLHSGSSMGWVPPGHTSFFFCVMLKIPKMIYISKNT